MPFSVMKSHYRKELAGFKEIYKLTMPKVLEALAFVRAAMFPFGLYFIQEIKKVCEDCDIDCPWIDWDERDMDWAWLHCFPCDFLLMEIPVRHLFVRNIILRQLS